MPITDCLCEKCRYERIKANPGKMELVWTPGVNFRYACEICGNKRCPHHYDHRFQCTNSNEPNQTGVLIDPS